MNARTCRRTAAALIAALLGAASASAQQPYLFELIADTRSGFTDLSLAPSINANGAVAFRAESAGGGSGIFVGGNGGAPTAIVNNAAGSQFLNFGISDPRSTPPAQSRSSRIEPMGAAGSSSGAAASSAPSRTRIARSPWGRRSRNSAAHRSTMPAP
jgi:hypothetical protein